MSFTVRRAIPALVLLGLVTGCAGGGVESAVTSNPPTPATSPAPATDGASSSASAKPTPSVPTSPSTGSPGAAGGGNADLTIVIKPSETAAAVTYTLTCSGGDPSGQPAHPDPAGACAALLANGSLLFQQPPPTDQACTMQFGGPETATVTGTVDGRAVNSTYTRANGCNINEWDSVVDILGPASGDV